MPFDINQFIQKGLVYGGARPSKFDVLMTIPAVINTGTTGFAEKLQFTCKSASIPSFTVGEILIPYFGRKIKSAGDRVWEDWEIMVMLDEDYLTRFTLEAWNNSINSIVSNVEQPNNGTPTATGISNLSEVEPYKGECTIVHYSKDNIPIASYNLVGVWPRQVGAITLDWDGTDRISEFRTTLAYDYMVPNQLSTGKGASKTLYGF